VQKLVLWAHDKDLTISMITSYTCKPLVGTNSQLEPHIMLFFLSLTPLDNMNESS